MNWPYHYTPYIWPSFFAVVFLIALSVYSWRRRSVPGALPFAIACIFPALWGIGGLLESAAVDAATKFLWVKFQGVWQLPTATAVLCFILEYAYPGRWLTRRNLILLSIPPLLVFVLVLMGRPYELIISGGYTFEAGFIRPVYNTGYRIFLGYVYLLTLVNFIVFAWLAVASPLQRWPVILMAIGQILGRLFMFTDVWSGAFVSHLRIFFPPFIFPFAMYAVALFAFRIFDPVPLARQTAIEQLYAGMLVLDPQGRIVSLNPSAERILRVSTSAVRRLPIRSVLPAYPDGHLAHPDGTEIEFSLEKGQEARNYTMGISLLKDWRGLQLGQLLLLHDVTEQKTVQAQLMEQARALSTLQERDRVARELHDDLGQVLGYIKMQAQAAHEHLVRAQTNAAEDDLAGLVEIAQDAHTDVREYILGASSWSCAESGLLPALRQYLRGFAESYAIRTELTSPPEFTEGTLEPTVEVQLLRIIQEALTNTRKHAHAHSVKVSICLQDGWAEVAVQDDGKGFDPKTLVSGEGQKFGLRFMRERAEGARGSIEINSAPGEGTRVIICVPLAVRSPSRA